jgi:TetR/AcrR family transcriptional regulator, mexJK operon transcriptional repressor
MTPKKDKPTDTKNTRQRILDAATDNFRTLGYARTTTKAIAVQADVAEVTLFRHFGNKQKLFHTAAHHIGGAVGLDRVENQLTGDLLKDLLLISQYVLPIFIAQQETIRMLMFESSQFPEVHEAVAQNPRQMCLLLSGYFRAQIEEGHMQNLNPHAVARAFTSMLFGYAVAMQPLDELLPPQISLDEMIEQFVHIFVEGVASK